MKTKTLVSATLVYGIFCNMVYANNCPAPPNLVNYENFYCVSFLDLKTDERITKQDIAIVKKNNKFGVVNDKGNLVIPFEYDKINSAFFKSNRLIAEKNKKYGLIDYQNNIIAPFQYDVIYNAVYNKGELYDIRMDLPKEQQTYRNKWKYGLMDNDGNIVIPMEYHYINGYSEGLYAVRKDNLYGFIDNQNKVVIPFEYEDAKQFSESLAAVKKNDKWGFINKAGKVIIPFKYDFVLGNVLDDEEDRPLLGGFYKGKTVVANSTLFSRHLKNDECFLIDKKGKILKKISETHCDALLGE